MKKIFCISIFLSMFFQGCMSWPLLTGLVGLTAGKKSNGLSFFHLLLGNSNPTITRIELSYQDSSIANGTSTTLEVTAIFDNGTNQNITDSTSIVPDSQSVVTIQGNRVRGIASGSSIIKAEYNGLYSEQKITVTPATLNSIQVTSLESGILPKGTNRQFSAIGIFSDGSHQDISNDPLIVWSSSNPDLVQVDDSGLASGINLGTAHIRASFQSKQGAEEMTVGDAVLSQIQVTSNNPNIPLGKKQKLIATGIYSDNSNRDISSSVIWNSSNSTIANIQNNGILETADTGIVTISASSENIIGSVKLIVTPAALVSISVSPTNSTVAKGLQENFKATGIFTDNSNSDITDQVTWDSSNTDILSISNASDSHGLASTLNQGNVKVTASIGGIQGSTDFTVTQAALTSIEVSPVLPSIAKGLTQKFTAIGIFTDNSKKDITDQVTWNSSSAIVSVSNLDDNKGLGKAHAVGDTTITATLGKVSGKTWLTVVPAVLTSIQINPVNPSLAKGLTQKFSATGIYSDNSNKDITSAVTWFSSDSSIATISNAQKNQGNAYGAATGATDIKATFGKVSSPVSTLSVTAAKLVEIQITPAAASKAKGLTERFKATGIFTDNSNSDITNQVTWNSSNTDILTVSNTNAKRGLGSTLKQGTVKVTASMGGIEDSVDFTVTQATLTSIEVSPTRASIAKGMTQKFTATGIFTDHSKKNITEQVTWKSSSKALSMLNAPGEEGTGKAIAVGNISITATLEKLSGKTDITVTPAILTSIQISPVKHCLVKGLTEKFSATGIYSDNSSKDITSAVTWHSSNNSVATISNTKGYQGQAHGTGTGTVDIKATLGNVSSQVSKLSVTAAELIEIVLNPTSSHKAKGLTENFKATGVFTDNSTKDITDQVTWKSSNTAYAKISNATGSKGVVNALSKGTSHISATLGSISSANATFQVTPAKVVSIEVIPNNISFAKGNSYQFKATGIYTDHSEADITEQVTWSSSNPKIASVENTFGSAGLVNTTNIGSTNITAKLSDTVSGSSVLNVTPALLRYIMITPSYAGIEKGYTKQFSAIGTYSDQSTKDLTEDVTWFSSNPSSVVIENTPGKKGLAFASELGEPDITVFYDHHTQSSYTPVTVTESGIVNITISLSSISKTKGSTHQFKATGKFENGAEIDLTELVTWSSSNPTVVSISNVDDERGLATALSVGSSKISVDYNSISSSIDFEVTPEILASIKTEP
ncbi:Ig-like domain-containing protein [Leptospira interrogans]|uniref:Ig-like domain-containing protein n=1 Tax=Leptospira interrogans TaxID=173 RepID=UPI001C484C35|nr:Ig-like domain-containing protein [Leptospira interrogans]MBV6343961.1 Ig-like domain-containing protein [Leptospira interrogans]MBV6349026.1 Ig-like domain-containing protein [Leptospira interrogans]MBV6352932.1 Ig-like domain-containing protein [Leptospira interrogans]